MVETLADSANGQPLNFWGNPWKTFISWSEMAEIFPGEFMRYFYFQPVLLRILMDFVHQVWAKNVDENV